MFATGRRSEQSRADGQKRKQQETDEDEAARRLWTGKLSPTNVSRVTLEIESGKVDGRARQGWRCHQRPTLQQIQGKQLWHRADVTGMDGARRDAPRDAASSYQTHRVGQLHRRLKLSPESQHVGCPRQIYEAFSPSAESIDSCEK